MSIVIGAPSDRPPRTVQKPLRFRTEPPPSPQPQAPVQSFNFELPDDDDPDGHISGAVLRESFKRTDEPKMYRHKYKPKPQKRSNS